MNKLLNVPNRIARTSRVVGLVIFVLGFVVGILIGYHLRIYYTDIDASGMQFVGSNFNVLMMLNVWTGAFLVGIFFVAISEIIQLLDDIKNSFAGSKDENSEVREFTKL